MDSICRHRECRTSNQCDPTDHSVDDFSERTVDSVLQIHFIVRKPTCNKGIAVQPSTIKIFLVNGTPQGLRTAEISNWTGKALACPRTQIDDLLSRAELKNPGVYVLSGDGADVGEPMTYVGEAEVVHNRIKSQLKNLSWWERCVVFTSKDENLTKAHIRFLEGRLIERGQEIARTSLENSQGSSSRLPESDAAEMEVFLEKIYQLLPILGIDAFSVAEAPSPDDKRVFYCKIKGLVAMGRRTVNGFEVFKDSEAVLTHRPSAVTIKKIRERLADQGVLKPVKTGMLSQETTSSRALAPQLE